MELIDIGANLTHDSFDRDRDQVIRDALQSGVAGMVVTGSTVEESIKAAELSKRYPHYLCSTAGVHPHYSRDLDASGIQRLKELFNRDQHIVAVGECGLDHFRNFSTPEQQRGAFLAQLDIAADNQKPVFLHQRDAHEEFKEILTDYRDRLSRAVAHCFTGSEKELKDYLDLDLYIGITGWICDERRGHHLRDLIPMIPKDRLMIETDAPYLLPRDLRPKPKTRRNEPKHLPHIARVVAESAGVPVEDLSLQTRQNTEQFFDFRFDSQML